MNSEDGTDLAGQVADLNRYGQALNSCESVGEVVSLTLEAVSLLFEFPYATFLGARSGSLRVLASTYPPVSRDDEPGGIAWRALECRETVVATGDEARAVGGTDVGAALAVPVRLVDGAVAVVVTRSSRGVTIDDRHVRPMEILTNHAATAIGNIRSRERLKRTQQDLAKRKEMVEMYDRLLRHHIGNDLQVVESYGGDVRLVEGEVTGADFRITLERA